MLLPQSSLVWPKTPVSCAHTHAHTQMHTCAHSCTQAPSLTFTQVLLLFLQLGLQGLHLSAHISSWRRLAQYPAVAFWSQHPPTRPQPSSPCMLRVLTLASVLAVRLLKVSLRACSSSCSLESGQERVWTGQHEEPCPQASTPPATVPHPTPNNAPSPANPRELTLGSDHTDNYQQQEAKAHGNQEEAGSRAETPKE